MISGKKYDHPYYDFFEKYGKSDVAEHCCKVADEAEKLAVRFRLSRESAVLAAYLHDIGRVYPDEEFINIAQRYGLKIYDEERLSPGLLHQRISKEMARELFRVGDETVLNAIGCHTTLKAKANELELALLIADKLSWDSADNMHIVDGIRAGLEVSLMHGAYSYLAHIWQHKESVASLHPWTIQAYWDLREKCGIV